MVSRGDYKGPQPITLPSTPGPLNAPEQSVAIINIVSLGISGKKLSERMSVHTPKNLEWML